MFEAPPLEPRRSTNLKYANNTEKKNNNEEEEEEEDDSDGNTDNLVKEIKTCYVTTRMQTPDR